jgi:hypothetical protein
MGRSLAIFTVLAAGTFGAGFLLSKPGAEPVGPPARAARPADDGARADVPADEPGQPPSAGPAPVQRPLVGERWLLPEGWGELTRDAGVFIDPDGPRVVCRSAAGALSWNAATGEVGPAAWRDVPGPVVLLGTGSDHRLWSHVRDRQTNATLLDLHEQKARVAAYTPDRCGLLVIHYPSVYEAYNLIELPSGNSREHPREFFKNVELYDLPEGGRVARFCPRDCDLDDDIRAVAVAADGQSFYALAAKELYRFDFQAAFGVDAFHVRPTTPRVIFP